MEKVGHQNEERTQEIVGIEKKIQDQLKLSSQSKVKKLVGHPDKIEKACSNIQVLQKRLLSENKTELICLQKQIEHYSEQRNRIQHYLNSTHSLTTQQMQGY